MNEIEEEREEYCKNCPYKSECDLDDYYKCRNEFGWWVPM